MDIQNSFFDSNNNSRVLSDVRLLSAQLGTEFAASRYDDIKKVYSIWLCMDTNEASANTITSYEIHPRSLDGEPKQTFNCDILRAVMVCVGKKKTRCYNNEDNSGAQLLDLLNVILDDRIPPSEKLGILESDFSIEVTDKMREEMNIMCNLSDLVEERGIKLGMERGMERGIERGIEQGVVQGEMRKIYELVNNYISRKKVSLEEACYVLGVSLEDYYKAEKFAE